MVCRNFKAAREWLLNNWIKIPNILNRHYCIVLEKGALTLFKLRNLKGNANPWSDTWVLHLKLIKCKGDINISKQTQKKEQIPDPEVSLLLYVIFIMLGKIISYRCDSKEGATVWCPSLAPLFLASLQGLGATEVIKNALSVCQSMVSFWPFVALKMQHVRLSTLWSDWR